MKNIFLTLIVLSSLWIMAFTSNFDEKSELTTESTEEALYEPIVVLELFTSQGCSSCPSADVLLQKVKKEFKAEVFALSYHVDYWNYIGWKDPFSKAQYSEKQRAYNIKFRNRSNYTPQLVVNGKEHFVGSSSAKMYSKIETYKEKKAANSIALEGIAVDEKKVSFKYDIKGSTKNKVIRTLLVLNERTTEVKRGENKNRTLQNANIVIAETSFAIEEATGAMKISVPEIVESSDKMNLIVLVENIDYDITAAAKQNLVR